MDSDAPQDKAWVSEPSSYWKFPTSEICLTKGRGKGVVICQLLKGIRTGPTGTGRDPSAAQTAELAAKMLTEAINPLVPRSGRPISWDQTRISSPASCSADAKTQLNYDVEQYRGKGICFWNIQCWLAIKNKQAAQSWECPSPETAGWLQDSHIQAHPMGSHCICVSSTLRGKAGAGIIIPSSSIMMKVHCDHRRPECQEPPSLWYKGFEIHDKDWTAGAPFTCCLISPPTSTRPRCCITCAIFRKEIMTSLWVCAMRSS